MSPGKASGSLMPFNQLPKKVQQRVFDLAQNGHSHPDPSISTASYLWASNMLSAKGKLVGWMGIAADFLFEVITGGGGGGGTGLIISRRRMAKKVLRANTNAREVP